MSTLEFCNGECLKLERFDSMVWISFFSDAPQMEEEEGIYFRNICVEYNLFEKAAIKALDEYFSVVERLLKDDPNYVLNKALVF